MFTKSTNKIPNSVHRTITIDGREMNRQVTTANSNYLNQKRSELENRFTLRQIDLAQYVAGVEAMDAFIRDGATHNLAPTDFQRELDSRLSTDILPDFETLSLGRSGPSQ